jgi:phosphoenolpyruvate carboxylase
VSTDSDERLNEDVSLLTGLLDGAIASQKGAEELQLLRRFRDTASALRAGSLEGGRTAFGELMRPLTLKQSEQLARNFTQLFHLLNAAEEQHRIRVLRRRDRPAAAPDGTIAHACLELKAQGSKVEEVRELLGRLLVMPVLTAHPTEARRSTVLDHLEQISKLLDRLDDPRPGERERREIFSELDEAVLALSGTSEQRPARPTPIDELRAGLQVFERTLMEVTPSILRALEEGLRAAWPDEPWSAPLFLRWGTWIGGDRDGNPFVTAEVTRTALERQRTVALQSALKDASALGRELSIAARVASAPRELLESVEADRARLPEIAAQARRAKDFEPWREKLTFVQARLKRALVRAEGGYPEVAELLHDLELLSRSLEQAGLMRLARGRLLDARRRAEIFGFHTASLDLRQHSAVHEGCVAELLSKSGGPDYRSLSEPQRVELLARVLEHVDVREWKRAELTQQTAEVLDTLAVVGRARRNMGPKACERYVVSFTRSVSDVLEVSFLARAAGLSAAELRPVPLLEQLEDLEHAEALASTMLAVHPLKAILRGELEVMIGYSDSGKQVGYVPSAVALYEAQSVLAKVAQREGQMLTIFHGRGGAVGRGGGPASRAIRAQPPEALRGRLRLTEQGETIAARYARREIARRDLEQMVSAVLVGSLTHDEAPASGHLAAARRFAKAAHQRYRDLVSDSERLADYVVQATPIREISQMSIGSRPAARKSASPKLEDLRAIPWVFCWNQSRHGVPGWFGVGSALAALLESDGLDTARAMYAQWPFFRALVDNAQLAMIRADMDVAAEYAGLAEPGVRELFSLIREEFDRTRRHVLEIAEASELLADRPTLVKIIRRRNPFVDVLSHLQIELLRRLKDTTPEQQEQIRPALFSTIHGIAAGLQTAG